MEKGYYLFAYVEINKYANFYKTDTKRHDQNISLNRLELHFLESVLPENSDWISCSGCENSRSSGKKPNFDPKPQKTRNDSSYQFVSMGARAVGMIKGKT